MSSTLQLGTWTMPGANLGPDNPLPPLRSYRNLSSQAKKQLEQQPDYPDKGMENNMLPYRTLDRWDRAREPKQFRTAVLENEFLRATFLLELDGRLWSLVHKPTGRELLFTNPVFQPGNVAIRGAWITGGVEWNVGIFGHSPLTVDPLFAAQVRGDDGSPVLRLWEFERVRRIVFQIDCWLPERSQFLMVRVRIINPHDFIIPMYWWSNIAVAEAEGTRTLSPADHSFRHDYDGKMTLAELPMHQDFDATYAANRQTAADMYFSCLEGHRPFVASLDQSGTGLIQASTQRLYGRKMWAWGTGRGSRRWLDYLTDGKPTMEIQAGLAHTQAEYQLMPARTEWSWLEAYGMMQAEGKTVHGDWKAAWRHVEARLEAMLPAERMNQELEKSAAVAERAPEQILHRGSGWGALERKRREKMGERPMVSAALPFPDDSLGDEQAPWLHLLERGELPYRRPGEDPGSYMVQPEWHRLLEEAVKAGRGDHWLSWYHLGVMRFRARDKAGARQAWEKSLQLTESGWAYRNLAFLSVEEENWERAADLAMQAGKTAPQVLPLAIEVCQVLTRTKRHAALVEFVKTLPAEVYEHGRIRMMHAAAAMELGDLEPVRRFFEEQVEIQNVREAELSVTDLWFEYHEHRLAKELNVPITQELIERVEREFPPPWQYDFRMHGRRVRKLPTGQS